MVRLPILAASLANSASWGRIRVHEILSARPIGVDFGILLDERGHPKPTFGNKARTRSAQGTQIPVDLTPKAGCPPVKNERQGHFSLQCAKRPIMQTYRSFIPYDKRGGFIAN
jgi:hypothetical protein